MDTTDNGVGATGTIPGFPEVPADLESFTYDASSFPNFPRYLNSGPPTSPATAAFIDDYLNAPTSPQVLEFEGAPVIPEPQAPATTTPEVVPEVVPAPTPTTLSVAAATGMTTGTTPKPRSPRRSRSPPSPNRSNPNRFIAPNTPAEGIARPNNRVGDSATARSQIPDANNIVAASPEEEDVNAIPTKGPLGVRNDTIAVEKRATLIANARGAAKSQSPRSSAEIVQRARRSARPNRPEPGAMTISLVSSVPRQQMPTDEEEADTESDTAIRRSNSENQASSSSEQKSDQGPSKPKQSTQTPARPGGARSAVEQASAQKAYRKAYDDAPDKSNSQRYAPRCWIISGFPEIHQKEK
jgi:hypothetical protein